MTESPEPPPIGRLPGLGLLWAGIGLVGLVLTAFLVLGLVLPGEWEVQRERDLPVPAAAVFPYLADLSQWSTWTHWPELRGFEAGADTGVGASRSWDDSNYGRGTLTLVTVEADTLVRYDVSVDRSIRVQGTLRLSPSTSSGTGVRLTWTEEGDFGRNPLLAYTAMGMDRMQGREMEKSLDRLMEQLRP